MEMGKAMFETGDIAGYQALILKELNFEVGGAAEAMGNTLPGALGKLQTAFDTAIGPVAIWTVDGLQKATTAVLDLSQFLPKLNQAIIDHTKAVSQDTTYTYELYKLEVLRSYGMQATEANVRKLTEAGILYTQSTWEAVNASDPLIDKFDRLQLGASNFVSPLTDAKIALDALKQSMDENTTSLSELSAAAIYNEMALGLDEQGALDLAIQMGLLDPVAYNYRQQLDLLKEQLAANLITSDQYNTSVATLNTNLHSLHDVTYTITQIMKIVGAPDVPVNTNTVESGPTDEHYNGETLGCPPGYQWWWKGGRWVQEKIPGKALGGPIGINSMTLINENPLTYPETVVVGQNGGGYVLTKQDAQEAIRGVSGTTNTFNFMVPNEQIAMLLANRVAQIIGGQ
jgi:tetratricopeptide (TPR) repeat protein